VAQAVRDTLQSVTRDWEQAKRRETRERRIREQDWERFRSGRALDQTIKKAAWEVMADAYAEASDGGALPANARQIMYAARRLILQRNLTPGGRIWADSSYFTQQLLPDYAEDHPEDTATWDVTYDDRGHFEEPHRDGRRIGVGTLAVRSYIREWTDGVPEVPDAEDVFGEVQLVPTKGPANRYTHVLFIEKEGFAPLLERAKIAERFDLAIMSTKGMSVTAARHLVEALSEQGVVILVAHDFDKSGLSILGTLGRDTRRYTFTTPPNIQDLGLRLDDVRALKLAGEHVVYTGRTDPRANLRANGATPEEVAFLVKGTRAGHYVGTRVELNEMTSRQMITWLEGKLRKAGVRKVIPDKKILAAAYRRAATLYAAQRAMEELEDGNVRVPQDLERTIRSLLRRSPESSWDEAIWRLVDLDGDDGGG
jgi:hypothetical protein